MRCALTRFMASEDAADKAKRKGWLEDRILVVAAADLRLTPDERRVIKAIGQRLFEGKGKG